MRELRSYVVRIYRQGARTLTGVVEDTRDGTQRSFDSADQLWRLLRRRHPRRARVAASVKGCHTGDDVEHSDNPIQRSKR